MKLRREMKECKDGRYRWKGIGRGFNWRHEVDGRIAAWVKVIDPLAGTYEAGIDGERLEIKRRLRPRGYEISGASPISKPIGHLDLPFYSTVIELAGGGSYTIEVHGSCAFFQYGSRRLSCSKYSEGGLVEDEASFEPIEIDKGDPSPWFMAIILLLVQAPLSVPPPP